MGSAPSELPFALRWRSACSSAGVRRRRFGGAENAGPASRGLPCCRAGLLVAEAAAVALGSSARVLALSPPSSLHKGE